MRSYAVLVPTHGILGKPPSGETFVVFDRCICGIMEDDYRSFEPINIGLSSVETGQERFTRDGAYVPPPLSYWRCNLTALSQRFNLHFVATRDTVAVYQPEFPFQKLRRLPALLIPPVLANPHVGGYIDDRVPHAINHLIVGVLGKEEILLAATDSGNVTGYYTKTIEEAIRKDPYRFSTDARSDYVRVRPFFSQWVHESAWGLAIHTNARMIAVSANTPHHVQDDDPCAKVTVFAFALTDDNPDGRSEKEPVSDEEAYLNGRAREPDWEEWTAMGVDAASPARNRNYKITLAGVEGHDHNIPCISFVNTDDDLTGNWLLSTDIGGELKIWQIWQGIRQKSWDFADKRMRAGFFRRGEGAWLVAALDPRSFRPAKTMDQFCGHTKAPQYHGHSSLESYDLTHIVRLRTPGNSHAHPLMYSSTEDDNEIDDNRDVSDSWSNIDEATVEADQGQSSHTSRSGEPLTSTEDATRHPSRSSDEPEEVESEMMVSTPQLALDTMEITDDIISARPERDILSIEEMLFDDADDGFEPDEEEVDYLSTSEEQLEIDDVSSVSRRSTTSLSSLAHPSSPDIDVDVLSAFDADSPPRRRQHDEKQIHASRYISNDSSVVRARGAANAPKIPTLHCSASNLRMLITPQADSPHIFCANILKQALPPAIEASQHAHIDRLNMFLQIPELGVVVIATQIGRAAVCSLTRNQQTGTFGLRVDWILPTKKQELKGLRPVGPLLGIAASPVQGRFEDASSLRSQKTDENGWGRDAIVDGVPTTFDPTVLVVEEQSGEHHQSKGFGDHLSHAHKVKRKRSSHASPYLHHHKTRLEMRQWEVPTGSESWQAVNSSRRYRLMLTYLDMTVLTYELSRGVEKDDVFREEVISTLELLD